MRAVYEVLDKIKSKLEASPNIQTVSFGDLFEINLNKTDIFPIAHINMGDVSFQEYKLVLNFNILFLDIVDDNRDPDMTDDFYGNNNLQDILNTLLAEANVLVSDLRRGQGYEDLFQVDTDLTASPFLDRFENQLAGWSLNINISFPNNEVSIC
jgi:hypothetical protein|tara:strand:+ start:181 stop:642 length:462 start_codon:yes stop_codon:yes gene_type:complete